MRSALAEEPVRNDLRPTPDEIALMREKAQMVRLETIRLIEGPKIGHYSSVFSCAEIFASLYYGVMSLKRGDPRWSDRDRFTYGKGHAAIGHFPILTDLGFLPKEVLDGYCSLGNPLGDHPDMTKVPGIDFSSGSIGHALSNGLGMAMGARRQGKDFTVFTMMGAGALDLLEVSLRQDAGNLGPAVRAGFRCPVRFGAEQNALQLDAAILKRRIGRSDEAYRPIIERYFAATRLETADNFAEAARAEIARQMEFGDCSLDSLSLRLRIAPRSLQRRLKHEGTSYRALVDAWRQTRALSLVTQTRMPLSQISLALGFGADQSVFSRAFQRWYGEAPLVVRHRRGKSQAADP
ncbi:helix-turn-helix domain-containing protein [Paracoccus sp. (in: a-proteobacteria)]|uniref:helix-turn-helix domain-containing protein n=1 Tax=Paracoccus sp. TaxID=267 RepID=UPI0035B37968